MNETRLSELALTMEGELAAQEVNSDGVAVDEAPFEERLRQWVLQLALHRALQRPRAEHRIVAVVRQVLARLVAELDFQPTIAEELAQITELDLEDALDLLWQVGEGLRASGVNRDEVFVTTKVWTTHFAPNDLERSVKESLKQLRLAQVDLVLLHWPNPRVPLAETLGALANVRRLGMARHIEIMITAVVIAVGVMLAFAGRISAFIERHPTMKMLALSFLLLIGVILIADGFGQHVSKGYIYFAMAFSVFVAVLNLASRRK